MNCCKFVFLFTAPSPRLLDGIVYPLWAAPSTHTSCTLRLSFLPPRPDIFNNKSSPAERRPQNAPFSGRGKYGLISPGSSFKNHENALRRNKGNRTRTNRELGIHKSTLFRRIKALGIETAAGKT
ncbi:MAG: hypothetical protein KBG09_05785 [Syntrophobacterales bacterium]|nr:hypothetical protein [Syntrophobacterales bacterium]